HERDLPTAQAAVVDTFRLIGEAIPRNAIQTDAIRQDLIAAGFRWPSAVSIFVGIKIAASLMLGMAGVWSALTFSDASMPLIPFACGAGFGYMLPDRVLERLARRRVERLRRGL